MRAAQILRHLGAPDQPLPETGTEQGLPPQLKARLRTAHAGQLKSATDAQVNLEFSPRDFITYLLSIDAEIEHCLMVQYLYAGYSLGGPQVPEAARHIVRQWQDVILGISKEEMGHLISVQNALRLIGAPLHLEREDAPWDAPFYPFPFTLEPLTLDALAKYVYAESPEDWKGGAIGDDVRARVHAQVGEPHQVAKLLNLLIKKVKDPCYLPDTAFDPSTFSAQADFAEWGRGYQQGQRGSSAPFPADAPARPRPQTPDVIVQPQTCRDEMVAALQQISEQGEATTGAERSHFCRFLRIFVEMSALEGRPFSADHWRDARPDQLGADLWDTHFPAEHLSLLAAIGCHGWKPARQVAVNPYVSLYGAEDKGSGDHHRTHISDPQSALWATLHNLRYRMLLNYLIHSFTLYGGLNTTGGITPRGAIINATFGEMYNLRALSEILMQSPVSANPADGYAGPPFQTPYTLNSPFGEANKWRGHLDLLTAADTLFEALLPIAAPERHTYLYSMHESDQKMRALANRILSGNIDTALI
jgi:hypothetical protein